VVRRRPFCARATVPFSQLRQDLAARLLGREMPGLLGHTRTFCLSCEVPAVVHTERMSTEFVAGRRMPRAEANLAAWMHHARSFG
jgi:hypothetical protein